MKDFFDKCVSNLLYGGVTKQEFKEIEGEVQERNRNSLRMTSACLVIMFTALFLGGLRSEMMAPNRIAYGMEGICFLLIFFLCGVIKKKGKRFIMLLWYVAMTLILVYAIILNTVLRKDISATTFCVIMMAAPMLIIDRPWRVFGYFSLVTCLFIPVDFHQKEYFLAYTDTVNALCCIFLGSTIHIQIMSVKMREMIQKRLIEEERDTDKLTGCLTKAAGRIAVSIGISICPENGEKYRMLFENADAALYTAKNLGRNRYVFCPELKQNEGGKKYAI